MFLCHIHQYCEEDFGSKWKAKFGFSGRESSSKKLAFSAFLDRDTLSFSRCLEKEMISLGFTDRTSDLSDSSRFMLGSLD